MIIPFNQKTPEINKAAFVAPSADIIGEVYLGEDASVWYNVSIRGDIAPIFIGNGSNVQDNSVLHIDTDIPLRIGNGVTIGHGAILHSVTIGDGVLVGMGAILINGAVVGENCLIGAGAFLSRKNYPAGSLILGNPAEVARPLKPQEIEGIRENSLKYVEMAQAHRLAVVNSVL
ncbi:MAG: gamma carbonic anhydrase family protein [Spirochaetales bacterium]|nr:gamma carbonic anhydrase family protein [Spirochaetales bacterium]